MLYTLTLDIFICHLFLNLKTKKQKQNKPTFPHPALLSTVPSTQSSYSLSPPLQAIPP